MDRGSQLDEEDEDDENDKDDEEDEEDEEEEEDKEAGGRRQATDIKSNNPHLAGGEKGKPTAAAPAAQTKYLSSPAAATLHGKHKVSCSGFLPKTEPLQHHAAIPMRSASTDSKTPYNYAHTSTPKAA